LVDDGHVIVFHVECDCGRVKVVGVSLGVVIGNAGFHFVGVFYHEMFER
jgi:hypothetical protein